MCMTPKSASKSWPKVGAKFHDGIWLELRMTSDESIIGTPDGVIKAKTAGGSQRIKDGALKKC